jgi:hypothetical protein
MPRRLPAKWASIGNLPLMEAKKSILAALSGVISCRSDKGECGLPAAGQWIKL